MNEELKLDWNNQHNDTVQIYLRGRKVMVRLKYPSNMEFSQKISLKESKELKRKLEKANNILINRLEEKEEINKELKEGSV